MYSQFNINESEKNRILSLHNNYQTINYDYVITEWLSPDDNYVIFLDELYDVRKKIKIGNIWENFDNFKFFLYHSFSVSKEIPKLIKESLLKSIDSFIITESNQNMLGLKNIIIESINEDDSYVGKFFNWVKDTGKEAISGTGEFINKTISGLKKTYDYVSNGDWSKAFDIIKKGALYIARSIRSALYHPVGMILDAILLATGIGKSAQIAIWSVVVGLDLYEFITGDYEDPNMGMGWRLLSFGIDIMGLVTTASAAKLAKAPILELMEKFGKTEKGLETAMRQNANLRKTGEWIAQNGGKADGFMKKGMAYLQEKSPKIYKWLLTPLAALGRWISKVVKFFYNLISIPGRTINKSLGGGKLGKGAQAAFNVGAPIYAMQTYGHNKAAEKQLDLISQIKDNGMQPDWSDIEV